MLLYGCKKYEHSVAFYIVYTFLFEILWSKNRFFSAKQFFEKVLYITYQGGRIHPPLLMAPYN